MTHKIDYDKLTDSVKEWGMALGFSDVRVADADLSFAKSGLNAWLDAGLHGEMAYMLRHKDMRTDPNALLQGTQRIISVRMDYVPYDHFDTWQEDEKNRRANALMAGVSIYARGRDYHRTVRARLQKLAEQIEAEIGAFSYRAIADSAPLLEAVQAEKAGLGWRGKNTLILSREGGSMFFLGELLVDLPLRIDAPTSAHCGNCTKCLTTCPTQALSNPYMLDARRCISYLTIEFKGVIPESIRPLIGNRIYGCDDCQLSCPWNNFARPSRLDDFNVRNHLDQSQLLALFEWDEETFLTRLEGSPIRRIGHTQWLRNIAIALGNALRETNSEDIEAALRAQVAHPSALVREHVLWALEQKPL